MGKTSRWLRNFLTGKKDKEKEKQREKHWNQPSPLPTETRSGPISLPSTKEKKRWSFRRSAASSGDLNSREPPVSAPSHGFSESDMDQKRQAMAVAAATAAAADAAVAATQVAAAVIRLTTTTTGRTTAVEEAAAIKIQAVFRSYLARKALCALKGLVKLQALVRGHLVRRQANATLRCMQALVTAQARARAQRIRMLEEAQTISHRQDVSRRSSQPRQSYEMDKSVDENVKIVEMDLGESRGSSRGRNSYSITQTERSDHRFASYSGSRTPFKGNVQQISPALSALTDSSLRTRSRHFEEFSYTAAQSSPPYLASSIHDGSESSVSVSHSYPFFPNYMANTKSSKAKARSQSAPKQRPDSCEGPPSRRRPSVEKRSIPRGVRMQRSSSHVGSVTNGYQNAWPPKLDRSSISLKDSECGSTSTVLTNSNYCRSLAAYEIGGNYS